VSCGSLWGWGGVVGFRGGLRGFGGGGVSFLLVWGGCVLGLGFLVGGSTSGGSLSVWVFRGLSMIKGEFFLVFWCFFFGGLLGVYVLFFGFFLILFLVFFFFLFCYPLCSSDRPTLSICVLHVEFTGPPSSPHRAQSIIFPVC